MTDHLDIEYVPVTDLEEWPGNARVGDVERIKGSMRQHGVFNPVIVQRSTNRVMIGNHRIAALRELHDEDPEKWDGLAPVIYYDVDDTQGTKINLIDNKLSDDAGMDDVALAAQLQAIKDEEGSLAGTGFIEDELVDILHRIDSEDYDEDRSDQYEEGAAAAAQKRDLPLDLIFSTSAASSAPALLGYSMGWNPGIITSAANAARLYVQRFPRGKKIMFMDNEWHGYDHEQHVSALAEFHPKYATVRDLVTVKQAEQFDVEYFSIKDTLKMAEDVAQHCDNVILIPKYDCIDKLPRTIGGKPVVLGYSVESSYGGTEIPPERFKGWPVHLLGGPWKKQRALLNVLKDDVVSIDNNNLLKVAQFGSVNMQGGTSRGLDEVIGYNLSKNHLVVSLTLSLANIVDEVYTLYDTDVPDTGDEEVTELAEEAADENH